jgi:hypothetical protein
LAAGAVRPLIDVDMKDVYSTGLSISLLMVAPVHSRQRMRKLAPTIQDLGFLNTLGFGRGMKHGRPLRSGSTNNEPGNAHHDSHTPICLANKHLNSSAKMLMINKNTLVAKKNSHPHFVPATNFSVSCRTYLIIAKPSYPLPFSYCLATLDILP